MPNATMAGMMRRFWTVPKRWMSRGPDPVLVERGRRLATDYLGSQGRCLGSGSAYRDRTGRSFTKNANVVVGGVLGERIWWGDLDVEDAIDQLRGLAATLSTTVYVFQEQWSWPDDLTIGDQRRGMKPRAVFPAPR